MVWKEKSVWNGKNFHVPYFDTVLLKSGFSFS